MGVKAKPVEERFWRYVQKGDGCWLWIGAKLTTGYGVLNIGRKEGVAAAHRLSWAIHFGVIPPGKFVCHHCDVRACVRPDHLFLGTSQDNVSDMVRKGRLGDTYSRRNARKTHCVRGHRFSPDNTRWIIKRNRNPERHCIACDEVRYAAARGKQAS